jgi:hypothetical protein
MVEPPKRKRKRTPSDRAREARRLADRLEHTARARLAAYSEGDHPTLTERQTYDLDVLHADKRAMRREIYATKPVLEGRPVFKGAPGR